MTAHRAQAPGQKLDGMDLPEPDQACEGARSIMRAATATFACDGFDAASVAKIAAQARVSKANIFYHFESKEALYLEVVRAISARHADYAEALLERAGCAAEKLLELFLYETRDMFDNDLDTRLLLREFNATKTAPVKALAFQIFERNMRAVRALFQQGIDSGEFRDTLIPAVAAFTWVGARCLFFQHHDLLKDDPAFAQSIELDTYARQVHDLLIHGMLGSHPIGPEVKVLNSGFKVGALKLEP